MTVSTRVDGPLLIITIERAAVRNAVNLAVAQGIAAALAELDRRSDLQVGVLTGSGGNFCAGMDLKAFAQGELPTIGGAGFAGIAQAPPRKPLIAAVEGFALAGGFEIVLACDLIVASGTARFGLPEVKRGLVAAAGGLLRLPRRLSYHLAMELALTGRQLTAQEAREHGLLNRLVEPGQALQAACALAREIAANAPLAVMASKQLIAQSHTWPNDQMFALQGAIADPIVSSADALEGARAFTEKRAPVWRGC
jgi:enoyl-CoA hydratase